MSNMKLALWDSRTMLRRNLLHQVRYPSIIYFIIATPVVFLLLFVYVFGGTMGAGIAGASAGRTEYLNYITPGIIMLTVSGAAPGTAISVSMDMAAGIMARFRTMNIARVSVLTGHVVGSLIQTLIALPVVLAVAFALGFRSSANPVEWLAALGVIVMIDLGLIWLAAAMGLAAKTVESASNLPMPLIMLPFIGSGFVPTESMPTGLAWFADYQPFTPMMETLRGLLFGSPIGNDWILAIGWSVALGGAGYLWARRLFNRDPSGDTVRISAAG